MNSGPSVCPLIANYAKTAATGQMAFSVLLVNANPSLVGFGSFNPNPHQIWLPHVVYCNILKAGWIELLQRRHSEFRRPQEGKKTYAAGCPKKNIIIIVRITVEDCLDL